MLVLSECYKNAVRVLQESCPDNARIITGIIILALYIVSTQFYTFSTDNLLLSIKYTGHHNGLNEENPALVSLLMKK